MGPARVRRPGGQVVVDVAVELAPGASHLLQGGAGPQQVEVVLPRQGLQQDVLLAGEVVHHLAGAHVGPPGYLRALDGLEAVGGITIYGPRDPARRTSLVAFNLAGRDLVAVAEALNRAGVESRAGCHCATLAHHARLD